MEKEDISKEPVKHKRRVNRKEKTLDKGIA